MYIFRSALSLVLCLTAVAAIDPRISQQSRRELSSKHVNQIESRQAADVIKRVLKVWIKIGKSAAKAFEDAVNTQNQAGAGFFQDFSDLVDQLPDAPDGVDQSVAPTKRSLLEKRSVNQMTMCKDSDSGAADNCKIFNIQDGSLTSGFEVDSKQLTSVLGGGVSAIRIETPGIICGFGTKLITKTQGSFFNTVGIQHCTGTRVLVQNDFVNLSGDLNDNVQCTACFKSPGA